MRPRLAVNEILDLKAEGINVVAFCPASRELFISHSGSTLKVLQLEQWNIDNKKLLQTYTCPKGTYSWDEVAVSPDGKLLVASTYPEHVELGARGKLFFIDTRTHKTRNTAEHNYLSRTITFDHAGRLIMVRTTKWSRPNTFVYDRDGNQQSKFDPNDFESENKDRLWDVPNSQSQKPPPGLFYRDRSGAVHRLVDDPLNDDYALTADGRFVGTSTWGEQRVRIWRTSDLKELFNEKMGAHPVRLLYDSKENQFLVLSNDNTHLRAIKLPRGNTKGQPAAALDGSP